ncbi:uncharacterized protein LOC108864235 [Galendromus occidentalis]|uniref:Uncharacterized protein LOC108864235 n=1 Tax=Galendromus occidentalis TaxID=34638 RepID=A0AAJ7P9R2_9ACAR|nr:uncharacterized protein LOC108864235 [Galendromus occidentalis]
MVLLKSPCRIALFRERVELPLPPKPVLTRWGSWIKTAEYYAENFEILRNFVLEDLDEKDAGSIKEAKNLFLDETIRANLVAIASNLSDIPHCITALEEYGLSLERSTHIVENLRRKMELLPADLRAISRKFENVIDGNTGFVELCRIRDVMRGEVVDDLANIPVEDLLVLKFAPIVSCEVERTFSRYKNIFRDNRHRFLFENLKKFVIVACNQTQ